MSLNFTFTDIDLSALAVTKYNYYLYHYYLKHHAIKFKSQDRLLNEDQKYDLIVSNPPYIKAVDDMRGVHQQVHQYEPHIALYLNDSEYNQWFIDFFQQVYQCLNIGGNFLMEGHEDHLEEQLTIAQKIGFKGHVQQDYTNRDRFLFLSKE